MRMRMLWQDVEDEELSAEEVKERRIMKMLLKVKNGTPPQRKSALRQLTDKARDLGAGPLFNQILPLLMSPTLEDQERHLLVKVGGAAASNQPTILSHLMQPCRFRFRRTIKFDLCSASCSK